MKRSSIVCQFALLAAIGCQGQPGPVADATPTAQQTTSTTTTTTTTPETSDAAIAPEEDATAFTLVSLKVPNMH